MSLKLKLAGCLIVFFATALSSHSSLADVPLATSQPVTSITPLRVLIRSAKEHAPQVAIASASLSSSRAARENARLAALGNPYLEVTADRGTRNVTRDVAVSGALWLPIELSGQGLSRSREAEAYISLHAALLDQARATAAGRVVRAYGATVVALKRSTVLSELLKDARAQAELIAERLKRGDAVRPDASLAAEEAARHEVMMAENRADLARARGELAELVGSETSIVFGPATPPTLGSDASSRMSMGATQRSRSLAAEARFYASSAERWRREGQSLLSFGLVAGRGDYGETRLGGGLAYAFPVFRSNRPERARATADSLRALAEKNIHEIVALHRLRVLQEEQDQLASAVSVLTTVALPAAEDAVRAVQETYAAGKTELLSVLLSRRELSTLAPRRLELIERSWLLVADYVAIAGDLP